MYLQRKEMGRRNNLSSWEFIAITCRNIYGSSTLHLLSTTGRLGPSYILLQCLALLTNILQGIQTHTYTKITVSSEPGFNIISHAQMHRELV